jgi:hypothetical protein
VINEAASADGNVNKTRQKWRQKSSAFQISRPLNFLNAIFSSHNLHQEKESGFEKIS